MSYIPPVQTYILFSSTSAAPFPNYRLFTAGNNVFSTDGGAQGNLTVQTFKSTTTSATTVNLTATSNTGQYASTAGGATVTNLPAAATSTDKVFVFVKTTSDANNNTITPNGTDTINGASTYVVSSQYQSITLQSDGATNWFIISQTPTGANSLGSYIVVSSTNAPANARTFTAGKNIFTTDNGAGSTFIVEQGTTTSISSVTTLTATSNTNIICSGSSFAVTLPAASNSPKIFTIVNNGTGTYTITCAGSDLIYGPTTAGGATYALNLQGQTLTIIAIGSNSWITL